MVSELYTDKQRPKRPPDTQIHVDDLQPLCSTLTRLGVILLYGITRSIFLTALIYDILKGIQSTSSQHRLTLWIFSTHFK